MFCVKDPQPTASRFHRLARMVEGRAILEDRHIRKLGHFAHATRFH